ncbi:hypothetical protein JCM11251_003514 [Rhodosporidiobolus azoricus]
MTLQNLAADPDFMEDLFHAQVSIPEGRDYRIVRCEKWERLIDPNFGKGEERLSHLSAGIRGFVEEGYIARHLYLAQWTSLWMDTLLGKPLPKVDNPTLASSYNATEDDVQALREMQVSGHPARTTDMLAKSGIKVCTVCKATASHPRAIFGMPVQAEHRGKVTESDALFHLPTFIRPFFEVHKALVEVRDKAVRQRDDLSVGIVAVYMAVSAKYGENTQDFHASRIAGLLEPLMDMTEKEVAKAKALAEAELATTTDKKMLLVASALEQLRKGAGDPTYPSYNLPSTTSALQAIDVYLIDPKSFFIWWPSPNKPRRAVSLNLPEPVRSPETLAAIRSLSVRAFETQDDLAVGAVQLVVRGCTRYQDDVFESYMADLRTWARYGRMIGKTEEEMRELRDRAEVELPKRKEAESMFIWQTVLDMRKWAEEERKNEPPPPWTPASAWPRTAAEVFGDLVFGPDGPLPVAAIAKVVTGAGSQKKKNRKKAKKNKASTERTGGNGAET